MGNTNDLRQRSPLRGPRPRDAARADATAILGRGTPQEPMPQGSVRARGHDGLERGTQGRGRGGR
jgi:hypothetical protein